MKNLNAITLVTLFFALMACAQAKKESGVPEDVTTAFSQKFPTAKNVKWDKENNQEWEAEFKADGVKYSSNFSNEGHWLETEYRIKKNEIPADIKSVLDGNFSDYDIEAAEISETAQGKSYEFEMEIGEKDFEVVVDSKGNITKKVEEKDSDED